ncbi:MAG: hypothetical protein HYU66_12465 [Armatimonadetes bacterium]|nr:hypothetical protein [Armatimonadota bacterium]
MKRDVLGLHIIERGARANPLLRRVRDQLQAADALITVESDEGEPEDVRSARRVGEDLLREARYEEAEEAFLEAIDIGLRQDWFAWQAALNLVNCHRFMGRLDDAEATAAQLLEMYFEQPDHPLQYLLATQRGAIAADRYQSEPMKVYADEALAWARTAHDWQTQHRETADALRSYNLVVALLRAGRADEARAVYGRHADDEDFLNVCRQGDQAEAIARMLEG